MDQQQIAETFQQALQHHLGGELDAAKELYERIIAVDGKYVDALTNLGALYLQCGEPARAEAVLAKSIACDVEQANAYNLHGKALQELGRYPDALTSYESAIELSPKNAGYFADRGAVLFYLRRIDDTLLSYDAAIALDPTNPSYYADRGVVLYFLKRYEEALGYYDCALILNPEFADVHNNRGNALRTLKRYDDALASYDKALAIDARAADVHNNRGNALRDLGRDAEAVESYDRAVALQPKFGAAFSNRGLALTNVKRYDDALASHDAAIALEPNHGGAYWNKALLKLLLGDFAQGWKLYEWRWKSSNFLAIKRNFPKPLWLGETPIAGKTILIHIEQGVGDFIQFSRYAPMLEAMGAKVFSKRRALVPLLQTISPSVTVVANGSILPAFDVHCPVMSLPLAMGTKSLADIHQVPYLSADPAKVAEWEKKLGPKTKPRIGLVWSGAAKNPNDANRSIPLKLLSLLLALPYEFHSLQKEVRPDDQLALAGMPQLHTHASALSNYADTAALVENLDLVISVDTSAAHLAGALAKPVWILLPETPDFRWLLARDDSPWYPSAKLFRQTKNGDWSSVVSRVIEALGKQF